MKNLQILALAMLFALVGVESIHAKRPPCLAGLKRNAQGKCVKASRVEAAKKADAAVKKAVGAINNSTELKDVINTNNAIKAYNQALNAATKVADAIAATKKNALDKINNLINMYSGYAAAINDGSAVIFVDSSVAADALAAANAPLADGSLPSAISLCTNGGNAKCPAGSTIDPNYPCSDGKPADVNGVCSDYNLAWCTDDAQSNPTCPDGNVADLQ
jgi:hypothetical protein